MSKNVIRTAITTAAVTAIATVFIAIACAPASPAPTATADPEKPQATTDQQDGNREQPFQIQQTNGNPTEPPSKPEATPTPEGMDCYTHYDPKGNRMESCRPLVPPIVDPDLQHKVDQHMAEKEKAKETRATVEPKFLLVIILTDSADAVDPLVEYLQQNTTGHVDWSKEPGPGSMGAGAYVNLEQVPTIAAMDGVIRIVEDTPADPAGVNSQGSTPTPLTAQQAMRVEQWHSAGIKGNSVQVGIIDHDFRNFGGQILSRVTKPVRWLCWDANKMAAEGITSTPNPDFARCQRTHQPALPRPHGTDVAAALLDIAPDVELFISNANTQRQVQQAVRWLTSKGADNGESNLPYGPTSNDLFDVRVINYSQTRQWDGPGDGTSPHHSGMMVSNLNVLDDAVTNGATWTNAAGNGARRTWFKRTTNADFNSSNQLKMDPSTTTDPCNYVMLNTTSTYSFHLRWKGQWEGQRNNADLNLDLYGPYPLAPNPSLPAAARVAYSNNQQNGGNDDYPTETFAVGPRAMFTVPANSRYCLLVTKVTGETTPAWIQLQSRNSGTTLSATSDEGHIDNPAESANAGMLAVGATDNNTAFTIKDFSARGPAPEPYPPDRIKPDVVSINVGTVIGTSFAAPRIAGLAALVIQALGGQEAYDTPAEIVSYLKTKATQIGTGRTNNEYGYGIVKLPGLNPPANLVLQHQSCNRDAHLLLTFDPPDWDAINEDGTNVKYSGYVRPDPATPGELSQIPGIPTPGEANLKFKTIRDATYYGVVQACPIDGSDKLCSIPSQRSAHVTVPVEICAPDRFHGIPGDGRVTLRWNHERHATHYQIEDENGNISTVGIDPNRAISNIHLLIDNLTNGNTYRFRMRAVGAPGTSEWSEWTSVTPAVASGPTKVSPIKARPYSDRIELHWFEYFGNATYKVQQWDGTAKQWRGLPFREKGRSEPYDIKFFYEYAQATAKVTGLEPGRNYAYRIMSLNGTEESEWSEQFVFQAAPGAPIAQPPATPTPVPNKTRPRDFTGQLSGNDVVLNWTPGYNPKYVSQEVIRRVAGVRPETWTAFAVGLNDSTYTDTTAVSGTTYIYRVRANKADSHDIATGRFEVTIP